MHTFTPDDEDKELIMERPSSLALMAGVLVVLLTSCGPPASAPDDPTTKPVATANTTEVTLAVTGIT